MYLLDTSVIAELGKPLLKRSVRVVVWAERQLRPMLSTSVVCLEELERAVAAKEAADPAGGAVLRQGLDGPVSEVFGGRVLPVDVDAARAAARLASEGEIPLADRLIAATARVHGLVVVTDRAAAMAALGVKTLNPWTAASA